MLKTSLSIIVPLSPHQDQWRGLLKDLQKLPKSVEIIFSLPREMQGRSELLHHVSLMKNLRVVFSESGWAKQLNTGARAATKDFLWFVSAESRFSRFAFRRLQKSITKNPKALHYFNLWYGFQEIPLKLFHMIGVWFRSHLFRTPFEDQGFCLSRENFKRLGGFREEAPLQREQVFIRRVRQSKIPVQCTHALIRTNSRSPLPKFI